METTFYNVIEIWLKQAKIEEVYKIKTLIDVHLGDLSTLEGMARHIKLTKGGLQSCKYIKDETGWDLRRSKDFMDAL